MERGPKPEMQKRQKTPDRNEAQDIMVKYLGEVALGLDPKLLVGTLGSKTK
jgi:hypothetical protein